MGRKSKLWFIYFGASMIFGFGSSKVYFCVICGSGVRVTIEKCRFACVVGSIVN